MHVMDIIRREEVHKQSLSTSTTNVQTSKGVSKLDNFALWHNGIRRSNLSTIESMIKCQLYGMKSKLEPKTPNCEKCERTKATKQPVTMERIKNCPDVTIHSDVCRPLNEPTVGGKHLFVTFTVTPHR